MTNPNKAPADWLLNNCKGLYAMIPELNLS